VLWHDHIADNYKAIALAGLFQNREEAVAAARAAQKRQSSIAGTGDKVQVMSAVGTMQAAGHDKQHGTSSIVPALANNARTGHPEFRNGKGQHRRLGHPPITPKYDSNGNLLTDNLNTYTWNAYGQLSTASNGSTTMTNTYDALGRMVENYNGSTYTEFVYGPTGKKLVTANGTTLIKAFIALPGGAKAIYNSSGLAYYRHSDWLGSSRLTSTASRTMYSSTGYAPFGEQYANTGTADASFTGLDQDTLSSLYDFPARRQSPSQGRWISPDPLGRGAVTLANPQSWNRYAYVNNNPLALIDPSGLFTTVTQPPQNDDDDDDDGCATPLGGCLGGGSTGGSSGGGPGGGGGGNGGVVVTAPPPPDVPTEDSTITCNTVAPNAPAGSNASVSANVAQTASAVSNDYVGTGAFAQWISKVQPQGSWDYAYQYGRTFNNSAFGNFNYGATCAAIGFSLSTCQSGAGAVDYMNALGNVVSGNGWTAGPGVPFIYPATVNGQPDYGDQTNGAENPMVIDGWDYTEQGCTD
jgi:RHS repeat-associated protein